MGNGSITIGANIASLQAQRQTARAAGALGRTFERLSSGLRVVRAADDAAGLSIASALQVDRGVYTQGIRNLNDGLSFLNIAAGAVDQMKTIVIRMRELASQSANGTLTGNQRQALDKETQALSAEYNRILASTEFNGGRVFDAARSNVQVQFGYLGNEAVAAQAGTGVITPDTSRVSVSSAGVQGNGFSYAPVLSADGRFVSFRSDATNLIAGDGNGVSDVYLRDVVSGTIERLSVSTAGAEGNGNSSAPSISYDGGDVAFQSTAATLVAGDSNGATDIFVRHRDTSVTERVSVSSSGVQSNGTSDSAVISGDGRYVAFRSAATNLDTGDLNGVTDVFLRDLQTGQTQRISGGTGAAEANNASYTPSISADGRYIAFRSAASNLVAGDANGFTDIFVYDALMRTTELVSIGTGGAQGNNDSLSPVISADGRYVAFVSSASNLTSGDANGIQDIFVRDRLSAKTYLISAAAGASANGTSSLGGISADGRYIVFQSQASNLVAGDTNGTDDIFVSDLMTGQVRRISSTPSGGETDGASSIPFITADAQYIGYVSLATNLVSGDTNGTGDTFLARNTALSDAAGFSSAVRPLAGVSVASAPTALAGQSTLDGYLAELNTVSGLIGAAMSRFETVVSTLGVRTENIAAAAARITDVDVAADAAELTRQTILQQAASAVLAQANQQPGLVLKLLSD